MWAAVTFEIGGVVSVDAQRAFSVDVGVAHGYDDGVDGDVHYDYVEESCILQH